MPGWGKARFFATGLLLSVAAGPAVAQGSAPLEGTRWAIVEVYGEPLPQDETPFLSFQPEGRVGGRTACNWFHGDYRAEDGTIVILTRLTTLRGCVIENKRRSDATLEALDSSLNYAIDGAVMTMFDGGGEVVAKLERRDE